jgi:uncharacterized protein
VVPQARRSDIIFGVDVQQAVAAWGMIPHPEGGFFREIYRSPLSIQPAGWPSDRSLMTSILYLLPSGQSASWHRVRGDELWMWQGGEGMVLSIDNASLVCGPDPTKDQTPQVLVPGGAWQSATALDGTHGWSLVGCVVAPGFDYEDWEMRQDKPG